MSDFKHVDDNINYSGIKNTNVRVGQKISVTSYNTDENDNIISTRPVINAIDIDWNNASAEEFDKPIKTTGDVLREIIKNRNLVGAIKVPKSIYELEGGTKVLTTDNFETIKEQLVGKSAYQIAKETAQAAGIPFPYTDEAQWIASLKGDRGLPGTPGSNGLSAYQIAKIYNSNIGSEEEWVRSLQGASAFQIAMRTYAAMGKEFPYANEYEWMESIINNDVEIETIVELVDQKIINKQDKLIAGEGINIENNTISTPINTWINITNDN